MKKLFVSSVILLCVIAARAEETGFQLALTPELQLHPSSVPIHGLSLNLFGQNEQHGVTLGVGNWISSESTGFSLGLLNSSKSYRGVLWGVVNYAEKDFNGWMLGVVNGVGQSFTGFQLGAINVTKHADGFQLGAFNYTDDLHGVQVGAINIVANNSWFQKLPNQFAPVFPIVNWSF